MEYKPVIGLEIHIELKTQTKMFCACFNDPDEKHPNINVCPVCMGHPGTLPVINKEAVKKVLLVGRALNGNIPEYSHFDRKNYFYPDLPKGYQISQYKNPLVEGGTLNGVKITRIHLEEDTGSLIHGGNNSLVDFNRAGVPLMELVTEPCIASGIEARRFADELRLILRYLDVSSADMEKGQMRVEVNISLSNGAKKLTSFITDTKGNDTEAKLFGSGLGTKVEIKNLNSFRAVEKAVNYEIKRQTEVLEEGGKIVHETRGWNENKEITFSQRQKEESHDYRYFPEPDLPVLNLRKSDFQEEIGFLELPQEKRKRFKKQFNLRDEDIEILIQDKKFSDYFEEVASELNLEASLPSGSKASLIQLAVNYLITDLQSLIKEKMLNFEEILITPENFAELINLIGENQITSRVGKDVLRIMIEKGGDPSLIIEEKGLGQINNESTINNLAKQIIDENPIVVKDYKKGKETALQFLIGQGMKKTKGSINPETLRVSLLHEIDKIK